MAIEDDFSPTVPDVHAAMVPSRPNIIGLASALNRPKPYIVKLEKRRSAVVRADWIAVHVPSRETAS